VRRFALLPVAVFTVAVLLPLATFAVASFLLGWKLQPVRSGSMEPTYPVGSLLVVEPVDASAVRPGMAVTFADPADGGRLVTHRVVQRAPGDRMAFLTQGDANATVDPLPVQSREIRGRVRSHVPLLGRALHELRWPRGFLVLAVVPALVLAGTEVLGARSRRTLRLARIRASQERALALVLEMA
jgi:signal peptidase I